MRWLTLFVLLAGCAAHERGGVSVPSKEFQTHTTPAVTSEEALGIINAMERDGWRVVDLQAGAPENPGLYVVTLRRPVKP